MHNKQSLVAIAMASYNGAKYIGEQLDSIIQQTYTPIEIVIVDDCSKDNTVAIIQQYQEKFSNIILHINQQNSGVTKTFEKAIASCRGK